MKARRFSQVLAFLLLLRVWISADDGSQVVDFNQTYRLNANESIDLTKFSRGGRLNLITVSVLNPDYQYCAKYKKKDISQSYLQNLNVFLESCLQSTNCTELPWSDADLVTVKCDRSKARSFAKALNISCEYSIDDQPHVVLMPGEDGSFHLDTEDISLQDRSLFEAEFMMPFSEHTIIGCDFEHEQEALSFLSKAVKHCGEGCSRVTLPPDLSPKCQTASGALNSDDLFFTEKVDSLLLVYSSEFIPSQGNSNHTAVGTSSSPVTKNDADNWQSATIALAVLFTLAFLMLLVVIILLARAKNILPSKKPPKLKFIDPQSKRLKEVSPYASRTLFHRKAEEPKPKEPSYYEDVEPPPAKDDMLKQELSPTASKKDEPEQQYENVDCKNNNDNDRRYSIPSAYYVEFQSSE